VCEDNGPNLNRSFNNQNKCEWVWGDWTDWYKVESAELDKDDKVSFLGGVHIGYNWQNGDKVFGIEGDLSFSDGIDYLASLRARLGHSWDSVLIYAAAGVAFAVFEDKTVHAHYYGHDYGLDISGEREIGFVVGGGIERKISSNVSVGLEGLYYFFDDAEYSEGFGPYCRYKSCVEKNLSHEDDNDLLVVRARLNYHIQPDEPSLETYK
jgi:opacity protein-like surface antigen